MDDFNNNFTPAPRGDDHNEPQNDGQQDMAPQQEPQAEAPQQQEPQGATQQQAPQYMPPQTEEQRTPYQTPVQHPVYQQPPMYQAQQGMPGGMPPRRKSKSRGLIIGLSSVAAACLLFAGGAVLGNQLWGSDESGSTQVSSQATELPTLQISQTPDYDPDNYDVVNGLAGEEIYKKVSPSIVSVIATNQDGSGGSGSGVIMSSDGYIITNNHVVVSDTTGDVVDQVVVQLEDGSQLAATVVGTDERTDLAVLKVESEVALTAAEFGDSDELQPGEYAYAIGSPGGVELANTITGGRISAINRDITISDRVMTLIQTDASINPGNSGGALINKYGQIVGITSAKLSSSGWGGTSYEGLGFAIPINTAKDVVDELIANGYVSGRPSIGITGQNVEGANGMQGVQVYSIDSRANAASEGLQVGDVITAVDGTPTPTMDEVNEVKENKQAGDTLTLTVYRISTGKTLNLTVTLTDAHDLEGTDPAQQSQQSQSSSGNNGGSSGGSQYDESPFSYFFNW